MKRKETAIVKNVDKLGRLLIPKEYRDRLHINQHEILEVLLEENGIRIRKIGDSCAVCGKKRRLVFIKNKAVCRDCLLEFQKNL